MEGSSGAWKGEGEEQQEGKVGGEDGEGMQPADGVGSSAVGMGGTAARQEAAEVGQHGAGK